MFFWIFKNLSKYLNGFYTILGSLFLIFFLLHVFNNEAYLFLLLSVNFFVVLNFYAAKNTNLFFIFVHNIQAFILFFVYSVYFILLNGVFFLYIFDVLLLLVSFLTLNNKYFNLLLFLFLFFLYFKSVAYAGQHSTKVVHMSKDMLVNALISDAKLTWGKPSTFQHGFPPAIADQLGVHIKSNLYHESFMRIGLAQKWNKELSALIPVKKIFGCESLDLFPPHLTQDYTLASFIKDFRDSITKNFPVVAKLDNNWYLFTVAFNSKEVNVTDLVEVSSELDSISNFYLNFKNDTSALNSAKTVDNMHDVMRHWSTSHKHFKEEFILRIPAGDDLAIFKNGVFMILDYKQIPEKDLSKQLLYIDVLNNIPHITATLGNYSNNKFIYMFIHSFNITDRSVFDIDSISSISTTMDVSKAEFFTTDLDKAINNLLDGEAIISADYADLKQLDLSKQLSQTLIKNVAKCLPPKFDL